MISHDYRYVKSNVYPAPPDPYLDSHHNPGGTHLPFINLTHKKQTRLNDCWYACMQMLKTWQAGDVKTKAIGPAVNAHRNAGAFGGGFWGHTFGQGDAQYQSILNENGLRDVGHLAYTNTATDLQTAIDNLGPLIIGGDFGQVARIRGTNTWILKGMGHYILAVGTDPGQVHIHDPWHSHRTIMPWATFRAQVWKATAKTIVAVQ